MFKPLAAKQNAQPFQPQTFMGKKGLDLRDLPQILSAEYMLKCVNYNITTDGRLEKRKGYTELFTTTDLPRILDNYTSDLIVFQDGISTKIYRISTDTTVTVKNDWSIGKQVGLRYGDYFFVCNGVEKIYRISQTLAYDAQTGNFAVGELITGGTSGATASVLSDADSGATGTLTLGNIIGTFEDNELITGSVAGSATVNGVLTFAITELTNSPRAKVLAAIEGRLYAGNLQDDSTAVAYSSKDDGTNPPFNGAWTVATTANSPGKVFFRNAGAVQSIVPLGQFTVVFGEFGKWAFYQNIFDSAGTLSKADVFQLAKEDLGGLGALLTDDGIFYVNDAGLWQMVSMGQQDVPQSDQEFLISTLLGKSYFEDVDFSNAAIAYDELRRIVLVTCAKDSETNNLVLVYNLDMKSFVTFSGWNITNFLTIQNQLYAASSIEESVYKLFDSTSDGGLEIATEYIQEINGTPMEYRSMLKGLYCQGQLSPSTTIRIHLDIYNAKGRVRLNARQYDWAPSSTLSIYDEWGSAGWGTSGYGGDAETVGLVEDFNGCRPMIRNYQRLRLRLTESSETPHIINWFKMYEEIKVPIIRRKLNKI